VNVLRHLTVFTEFQHLFILVSAKKGSDHFTLKLYITVN